MSDTQPGAASATAARPKAPDADKVLPPIAPAEPFVMPDAVLAMLRDVPEPPVPSAEAA